jgi:hypothetical protein
MRPSFSARSVSVFIMSSMVTLRSFVQRDTQSTTRFRCLRRKAAAVRRVNTSEVAKSVRKSAS